MSDNSNEIWKMMESFGKKKSGNGDKFTPLDSENLNTMGNEDAVNDGKSDYKSSLREIYSELFKILKYGLISIGLIGFNGLLYGSVLYVVFMFMSNELVSSLSFLDCFLIGLLYYLFLGKKLKNNV